MQKEEICTNQFFMKQYLALSTLIRTIDVSIKIKNILPFFRKTGLLFLVLSFGMTSIWAATPPIISSFAPNSGGVGTSVTLTGNNFNSVPANNVVFFGATKAVVTAGSSISLEVIVPDGASYQHISVTDITTGLSAYSSLPFITTFIGSNAFDAYSFATKADYVSGNAPYGISVSDLDGDSKPDLALTNSGSNTISIYRNISTSGSVSFAPNVDFASGIAPCNISVSDLNGDGKPDLVVTNNNSNSVSAYLNTSTMGTVSFDPKVDFATGSGPSSLSIADLDGDGRPDLAIINTSSSSISLLRNTCIGGVLSFASKFDITIGSFPISISTGDLDGDGKPELVVPDMFNSKVSVLRNTSTTGFLSFASKVDFATGFSPDMISIGDLDSDGKSDLAVINAGSNTTSILRNMSTIGTLAFATKVDLATGSSPYDISIGDLDGDGKPDLAILNYDSNTASILRNTCITGSVSFAAKVDFATGIGPMQISIVDLDGDGKPDIAMSNNTSNTFSVLKNSVLPAPAISSFSPTNATSGDIVTIIGNNFTGATSVTFGGTSAYSYNVVSPTTITAMVNGGSSGNISVKVQGGGTYSLAGFTYTIPPLPTIASFTPTSAPNGATVTITGSNFIGTSSVKFGGTAAPSYTVDSPTSITAIVGSGTTGSISITTPGGTASLTGFTYLPPAITSFTPLSGKPGAVITITGTNFTGATAVKFGSTNAASYTVVSPTKITAVVGTGSSGSISVTTPGGSASLAGFTFLPPPAINYFVPTSGTFSTIITITGTDFTGTTAVTIGGTPALFFNIISPTTINATLGTGSAGMVSVTTPNGTTSFGFFNYIYPPVISSVTPTSGAVNTLVTINGINFIGVTSVKFGSTPAASFTVVSPSQITAIVGPNSTGNIIITAMGGMASYPMFTYLETPTVSSFTPASGPVGTPVTITGTNFNPTPTNNIVYFGATKALVTASTSTSLSVIVPTGATYQPISVQDKITGLSACSNQAFNTTFDGSNAFDAYSYASKVSFGAGDYPYSVAVGDLDGDGKPDMVVVNNFGNSISLYRNTGSIGTMSFASRIDYAAGSYPESVSIRDLDGDGKPDLAVANSGSNTISVYRNMSSNGSLSFATKIDYATNNYPTNISTCDWDGDGKPDLATKNLNSSTVSILRNISTIGILSFNPTTDISLEYGSERMATGDLDGDGKPDMAVISSFGSTFSLYRNVSSGGIISFAVKVDYATSSNPEKVYIGDLDGDGKPDLAFTNNSSNSISLYRNTSSLGALSLATKLDYAAGSKPINLSIGDLNGDGKPDLAVVNNFLNPVVSLFLNTSTSGTLSFAAKVDYANGSYASNTSIGDMDGDGKPDLIVTNYSDNLVSVFRSTVMPTPVITSFNPTSATYGDVVTISGSNFTGTTSVKFGGSPANNFTVISPTTIEAVVGTATTGVVKVTVSSGANASLSGFTYITPPASTISSFTPSTATTGETVVITGTNFTGATAVSFGGTSATSYTINSSTSITAIVGTGSTGSVSVTTSGGTATLTGFTFLPPPVISNFMPTAGPFGSTITISGTSFTGATAVTIGGTPVLSYTVISPSMINATLGPGSTGVISVTTPNGTASLGVFTFLYSPVISSATPTSGPTNTLVTINGSNFNGVSSVKFGGTDAASYIVVSSMQITAIVGAGSTGSITVTTAGGVASYPLFTYLPAPTFSSFSPSTATAGETVVITGTNLTGATAVSFGGTSATSFTIDSPTSITAVVGSGTSGNVSITTPAGTISLTGFIFTVPSTPSISSFTPSRATAGVTVVITGTNLTGATAVSFGGTPATSFTVDSPTSIKAIVGSGASGPISVTTPKGTTSLLGFMYGTSQSITFTALNDQIYGNTDVAPGATASSYLLVTYTSSDTSVAKIVSNKVHFVGAGSCVIYANQPGNSVYDAAPQVSQNLTVHPKPVTVSGVYANNKVYDGTTVATLTGGIINGIISPDVVNLTKGTGTFTNKNAGNNKTVTTSGYTITGVNAGNYTLATQPSGITANITKAPVTITSVSATNKAYDGTTAVVLAGGSPAGIINPDLVTLTKGTGVFNNKNAGNGKTIITSGYTITGADANNYTLTSQPSGITANITPIPVSITGVSVNNKVYNGNTAATLNGGSLTGIISPDLVVLAKGTGSFTDKNVGSNKSVIIIGCAITGLDAGNYTLSAQPSGITANITPASVSITGVFANNKAYDGTTVATLTGGTLNGIFSPDAVTIAAGMGIFSDKNPGNSKAVSISGYAITGANADNYTLIAQPSGTTANITKATLFITGISAIDKIYDGSTAVTLTAGSLNGIISPDVVILNAGTGVFSDKNAGNSKTVYVGGYSITGANAGNYTLQAQPSAVTANISPVQLTIKANAGQSKNINATDPIYTFTITNGSLVTGETTNGALSRTAGETVGTYPIQIGTLTAGSNYNIHFIPDNFKITPVTAVNSISYHKPVVYPNPTSDIINLDAPEGIVTLSDQHGNFLFEVNLNDKKTIDLSSYASGLYILILKTKDSTYSYKITKL